ncbi:MAG: SCO family protein [Erythrobacter sp.]|uniref:SCO family protein n=1 Tax=Erythrobacter sp. TaxID=1042 RepID=UPI002B497AD0|nr:SCO family protein [Erythrobacter sp.]WRH70160.1 MAG: SCO family protein [Erythrobacter sp.]
MTIPAIFLASGFTLIGDTSLETAQLVTADDRVRDYHSGHLPPNPDQLGGMFNFSDLAGKPVGDADFKGKWTLLYFGYARCTDSCPMAIPMIAKAAKELRKSGIKTNAVFVDIEAPAVGYVRRRANKAAAPDGHVHLIDRDAALRSLQQSFGSELQILTGTRGQLSAATAAFRVAREHTPPRAGERGHSINHSSLVYILDPRAKVAGYGYHTSTSEILIETVRRLKKAKS